jgi:hypothetical protein
MQVDRYLIRFRIRLAEITPNHAALTDKALRSGGSLRWKRFCWLTFRNERDVEAVKGKFRKNYFLAQKTG